MKKKLVPIVAMLLLAPVYSIAGDGLSVWDKLGAGTIADADMFPITDVSDTTQSAEGSSKTATASQVAAYVATKITDATITTTDVTTNNASTSKHGWFPKLTAPSSGYLNVYGLENGETAATAKGLFDATVPSTQAAGDSAATGSAMSAARRDHKHAMPAAQTATTTVFTPDGSIEATTVQTAIQEVRDEAGGGGYTNLTSFIAQTPWRIFYSDGSGDVKEAALGADGEYFKSNGASSVPGWATPSGAAHDAVTIDTNLGNNLLGLSTQQLTLDSQTANYIFAAPNSSAGVPSFRVMVDGDIPSAIARDTELPTDATISTSAVATNDASTSKHGWLMMATAPAAGLRNILSIDNGETGYKNAALFDATSPTTQAFGDSAVVGTEMTASRRDHKHAMMTSPVSDTAYDSTSWDGVTTIAASKNAVRDRLEAVLPSGSDGTYGLTLLPNTTRTPTATSYELYPDAGSWRVNTNGTETYMLSASTGPVAVVGNVGGASQISVPNGTVNLTTGTMLVTDGALGNASATSLSFGADPADSGAIRLSNNTAIYWEAATPGTDIPIAVDNSNIVQIGQNAAGISFNSAPVTGFDLGNADTTLARSGAGAATIEGVGVVTTSSSDTLTNKTLDANGTGNVVKGYGYLTFTKPHSRGTATGAVGTTETTQLYGVPAFADDVEANNYVDYIAIVPPDWDTSIDPTATFKFRLGGADTADHDYIVSMIDIADSAAAAGTPGDAINLAYTADGSGADGDIETASGTLTGWGAAATAGSYWLIRVTRDGDDGTNDASTVDSYPMSLTIRYGFTQ